MPSTKTRVTKLKILLKKDRRSQYVIAGAANVHPTTLGEYANDKRVIPPRDQRAIAETLGCKPEDILGYA